MYANNGRPPFVSLEKAGVPVDIRGLRHAVADARLSAEYRLGQYRGLRARAGEQAEELRGVRARLDKASNDFIDFRDQVRALLVADFNAGGVDLETLNARLAGLGMRPHEDVRTVTAFVRVQVVLDAAQLPHGEDATDHVNALLRDAAEDACMSVEGAKDWKVSGR